MFYITLNLDVVSSWQLLQLVYSMRNFIDFFFFSFFLNFFVLL